MLMRMHLIFLTFLVALIMSPGGHASEASLTVVDMASGKPVSVYTPGMRIVAHLQMPEGQTLADFGEGDRFETTMILKGEGTRQFSRSNTYYKNSEEEERREVDMSARTLTFPVLVDPRENNAMLSPEQIRGATRFTETLKLAAEPGTYPVTLTTNIEGGPEYTFTVNLADEHAVATMQEIVESYDRLIPVTFDQTKQRIEFFDGHSGERVRVYEPGMALIARLFTDQGDTLGDLAEQTGGFDFRFKVRKADGTVWRREVTYGPDTVGFEAGASVLDVPVLVDPADFKARDEQQQERMVHFAEVLEVIDEPGTYTAIVDVNRGFMYEAHLPMAIGTAEAVAEMERIAGAYEGLQVGAMPEVPPPSAADDAQAGAPAAAASGADESPSGSGNPLVWVMIVLLMLGAAGYGASVWYQRQQKQPAD